jgi:hypothetical protein
MGKQRIPLHKNKLGRYFKTWHPDLAIFLISARRLLHSAGHLEIMHLFGGERTWLAVAI